MSSAARAPKHIYARTHARTHARARSPARHEAQGEITMREARGTRNVGNIMRIMSTPRVLSIGIIFAPFFAHVVILIIYESTIVRSHTYRLVLSFRVSFLIQICHFSFVSPFKRTMTSSCFKSTYSDWLYTYAIKSKMRKVEKERKREKKGNERDKVNDSLSKETPGETRVFREVWATRSLFFSQISRAKKREVVAAWNVRRIKRWLRVHRDRQ